LRYAKREDEEAMTEVDVAIRREEMRNRALLYEAAETLSSPDIGDLLPRFAAMLSRVIPYDRLMITRVHSGSTDLLPLFVDGLQTPIWSPGVVNSGDGTGLDRLPAQGLFLDSAGVDQFRRDYPASEWSALPDIQSAVMIGLTSRTETFGVLSFGLCEPTAHSLASLNFLKRLSVLLANALASSARLSDLRTQVHEQTVLAEVARIASSSFRLDQVGPGLSEAISRLIRFDWIHVTSVNLVGSTITARLLGGDSMSGVLTAPVLPLVGTATDAVIRARAGMIITPEQITTSDDLFSDLRPALDAGLRSAIAVPLFYRDDAIGALIFRSRVENAFTLQDVAIGERIAAQLSGPFANFLQHSDLERLVHERGVLAELGLSTSGARSLDATLGSLHSAVSKLFRCDNFAVTIFDSERSAFDYRYVRGEAMPCLSLDSATQSEIGEGSRSAWSEPIMGRFGSYDDSVPNLAEIPGFIQQSGMRSWVRAPLNQNDRAIGTIDLSSRSPDYYSREDVESLQRVSDQIAPAIDSAMIAERIEREATERAVLLEIARSILDAPDAVSMYTRMEEQIRLLFPFERMAVNRADFESNEMEYLHVTGPPYDGPGARSRGSKVPMAGTITEVVASTRRGMMFQDQGRPTGVVSLEHQLTAKIVSYGYHSGMAVPLVSEGALVGTLHFSSQSADVYTSHHLQLAEQIASLLAGSLTFPIQSEWRTNGVSTNEGKGPIQIFIIDSHTLCRESLRSLFEPGIIEISGESDSLCTAFQGNVEGSPNVILWGVHDGDIQQCDEIRNVRATWPQVNVLLLSDEADVEILRAVVAVGADGFLLRGVSAFGLVAGIVEIAAGGAVFDPGVLSEFLRSLPAGQIGPSPNEITRISNLSDTDRSILRAIGQGQTNAEISVAMGFAVGTVKNRTSRIYRSIHVSDRLGAASFAIRSGLVN
jgi:DNA-binding NarL/FixJ family response regulator/transcriptional regulator with GAF, ATPase, and Fis domain